jgi:uncharacterized caspase-like protein
MGMSARIASLALAVVLGTMLLTGPARPQDRVALVIGNSKYRHVPALANTSNDAQDVAASLGRLGFAVDRVDDGTFDAMRRGLLEFSRKARGAEIAIVFFAGHGIEVGGENWLIPIDAEFKTDLDAEQEAISLRSVMLTVSAASRLGLVMLDACRNNPFSARMQRTARMRAVERGLARVEPTGSVLIAFAARDGTTAADGEGRNSPFTAALLRHLETPGLEINFVFRNVRDDVIAATRHQQEPFLYGSLSKEPIFLKSSPSPELAIQLPAAAPPPATDEIAWGVVKDSKDSAMLKWFIENFPNSRLREEAEKRMRPLAAAAPADKPVEPLSRLELVRHIKTELARVGCYAGPIDDDWSSVETRSSVRQFAALEKLSAVTDEPAADLLAALRAAPRRVCPPLCKPGYRLRGGRCITVTTTATRHEPAKHAPGAATKRSVASASTSDPSYDPHDRRRRVTPGGLVTCGHRGCQTVPKGCYALRGGGGGGMGGRIVCP